MQQTLQGTASGGDRILANRLAYTGGGPQPQDIVVFVKPQSWEAEYPAASGGGPAAWIRTFGDMTGIGPSNEQFMVKRVIAVAGQTVSCCGTDGKVRVDGAALMEPYIYQDFAFEAGTQDCYTVAASPRCFPEFKVPEGHLVVLGDHRSNSSDSAASCRARPTDVENRCMRTVPETNVIGQVDLIIWPLERAGSIH